MQAVGIWLEGIAAPKAMGLFDILDEGCIFSARADYAVVVFDEMHEVNAGGHALVTQWLPPIS